VLSMKPRQKCVFNENGRISRSFDTIGIILERIRTSMCASDS
jgi:hypothetical protein